MFKKALAVIFTICLAGLTAAGCGNSGKETVAETTSQPEITTNLPKTDMSKWHYNEDDDVFYQLGIVYCETPADDKYEKLAVFVPAAYMDAKENGDGSYTCEINESAKLNGYSPSTAPIVMPIVTPSYYAAEAIQEYEEVWNGVTQYTSQGYVYVFAGCRGIDEGAPAGVTDLKAAIRYLRYCDDVIAGDSESIFVFGMSGGGAQAAILGASGNSSLYDPYLEAIGAVQGVSDAVAGSMDWCPVTNLDTADAEYEWMMGCTRPERSEEEQKISDSLANAYAEYVNSAGFVDENGNELTLTESKEGIYQAGSYYDYIKSVIEQSLNNYLSDTDFSNEEYHSIYKSAQDYVDDLNSDKEWIIYDKSTNTAKITSVADFVKACKNASDTVVGFDQPVTGNTLFGYGDGKGAHFDRILANVLTEINSDYAADYNADLEKTDSFGYTVDQRMNMYTPLYYLMESREGFGTSKVAKYWRIRSGIDQETNSLTTEVNLALALKNYDGVESVDFETVWAQGHTEAERTGDGYDNFIAWINTCMKG